MCTDVVSVSISIINKYTATYTMYITAGMNLLCNVCMIYIPIHIHTTPTCTWSPLNVFICSSKGSLFSMVVQPPSKNPPSNHRVGADIHLVVDTFLSLLLFILAVFSDLLPHIAWYVEAGHQPVHVHHMVQYSGQVAVSECSVCEGNVKVTLKNSLQSVCPYNQDLVLMRFSDIVSHQLMCA